MSMNPIGGYIAVNLESGASLSAIVRLRGRRIVAIEMPDAWTTAGLTFLAGHDRDDLKNVHDDSGAELSVSAAAARVVTTSGAKADALAALDWLQVRSGTSGVPVNQGAARTLYLLVK